MSRQLEASRRRFESRWQELQDAVGLEIGRARHRALAWTVALIGMGVGVALAWNVRGRRSRGELAAGRERRLRRWPGA